MRYLEYLFSLVLTASVASTVILILFLLIRKLFQSYIKPRILHILWFLVLIKLLVPVAPQSPISLFNALPHMLQPMNSNQINELPNPSTKAGSNANVPSPNTDVPKQLPEFTLNRANEPVSSVVSLSSQEQIPGNTDGPIWLSIGSLVWLGGFLCLGGYYMFSAMIFRQKVGNALKVENAEVLTILDACKRSLNIKKNIYAYETSHLRSPCLHGLWNPKIYLPEDIITIADPSQLRHILMHELVHYKRKDLWFNFLWILSLGIHWFNPWIWYSVRKMKADQEVACDASVLESLGECEAMSYGRTLLMLTRSISRQSSPRMDLSHFGDNKYEAKRRMIMIAKFKKGSYKLSLAAILLVIVLSVIVLTKAPAAGKSTLTKDNILSTNTSSVNTGSNLYPVYNDRFRWFHSLDRALDFPKYDYKVPDYLPDGYQLDGIIYFKNVTNIKDTNPVIDGVSVSFVSHFGETNEQRIEVKASKGNGNLLEHGELWGAPYSQIPPNPNKPLEYRQEAVTIGNVQGTLFTEMRSNKKRPETGKSFYWQDGSIWYAINYYGEHMSMEDLKKMVQSFVIPKEVQHVRYDGAGNSFPMYDAKDLIAAKNILGIKVKIPQELPGLQLSGSILLRAGDKNTSYGFRQATNALWTTYWTTTYHTPNGSSVSLYQSKEPLFDVSRLSLIRTMELDGVEISTYDDKNHVYLSSDKNIKLPYYLWKQNEIYYAAVFWGMDKLPENIMKAIISAPVQ